MVRRYIIATPFVQLLQACEAKKFYQFDHGFVAADLRCFQTRNSREDSSGFETDLSKGQSARSRTS